MIATIAVIAAAMIGNYSPAFSQRSLLLPSLESGFHMITELFFLSDHSDRSDHMETGLNLSQ